MKYLSRSISVIVIVALLFSTIVSFEAASPKLSKKKKTLTVGKTFTLTVKNYSGKFTWTTSNNNIVKIVSVNSKKNSVKLKAIKTGKATITAKLGKIKLKCKITVKNKKPAQTSSQSVVQPTTQPVEAKKTIKEYKTITYSSMSKYASVMTEAINKYAEEGWIVKAMTATDSVVFIVLERDKQDIWSADGYTN